VLNFLPQLAISSSISFSSGTKDSFLFQPLSALDEIVLVFETKVKPVLIRGSTAESSGAYDNVEQRKSLELATAK
jgi:hypothetical protein